VGVTAAPADSSAAAPAVAPPLRRVDLGEVPYAEAIEDMTGWVAERQAGSAPDRLFLLGHAPVVTYGRRTAPGDLTQVTQSGRIPVVEVDRGGYATYHGPGQLVGYVVLNIRDRGPVDIVRWLENGLVAAVRELGFDVVRRDTPPGDSSLVGVWTTDHRKVASIGMRIRHSVTSHGFALNIDPDMSAFRQFVVCGLADVTMTSLAELAAEQGVPTPADEQVRDAVSAALGAS
jgi:lipoate-protein ligase B